MKIKKGDEVLVISGKDRGKKGRVMRAYPGKSQVLVEKINYRTIYLRRTKETPNGGISKMECPIHVSNVQLIDPRTSKPTRVGYTVLADGTKQRVAKKSKEILS